MLAKTSKWSLTCGDDAMPVVDAAGDPKIHHEIDVEWSKKETTTDNAKTDPAASRLLNVMNECPCLAAVIVARNDGFGDGQDTTSKS